MNDAEPTTDADLARVASSGNLDAALVGAVVLLLAWPVARLLRRRRRRRE